MFRLTLLYSIPVTVIFIFFAKNICQALYHNDTAGIFLAVLAPVVPFMYLDSVVDGILKGLNEQTSYLIFNIIDSLIRVVLTYILLPKMGIKGMIIGIIVSELLNTLMSIARLIKVTEIKVNIIEWIVLPMIFIITPCMLVRFISVHFAVEIVICLAVYGILLLLTKKKTVC